MTAGTSAAAAELARRRHSPLQRVQHLLHGYPWISPLVILVLTMVVFTIVNPRFSNPSALSLLIQQTAVIACLAIGQTLIILTAGIDLSVGAIVILSMMVMAKLAVENGVPAPLALLIGIALGVGAGALNGLLVTRVNLPPFIVTLGTLSIFTAIALLYSGSKSFQNNELPDLLNWTGTSFPVGPFRLTVGVVIVLVLYAIVGFALSQTAWGQHVYAVGDDPEAARLAGIASKRVLLSVYVVAGLVYGIGAWVLIGRAGAASPNAITDANLQSITAVVIGGTSLFGGRGRLIGTLIGALIVQAFYVGLSLARVDQQYRLLAVGVLVIVAVAIDQWIRKVKS
ncbi:fructose transport system permease protein [Humibacillus xanthopallidus]|uniref:Fructose transport system permease protein n=1 Tax=Humibacillus xanthopallidus TaxID=412689 RepID=A0A543PKG9_9MICO|nr:ABC transporter permease [Humibacillus xanthopallidus]TQM65125.1 fructose transport system permease protein [Humibacillus xanthopallidus]TQN44566.1 fructose transport system permease protein [Humibacillus xanthopallidus]